MNISYFIARRLRDTKGHSFSKIIVKVGILSVALAVSVIVLSFFVLIGFKDTIKTKLFSQTGHLQIGKITLNRSFEETPMVKNSEIGQIFANMKEIKSVAEVAYKSVILKSDEEIGGVVLKGLNDAYDWSEFSGNLIEGRALNPDSAQEIILSKNIANSLGVNLNESIFAYFIQDPPRARKLNVVGIYDSKVEELDKIYTLVNLPLIQRINGWEEGEFGHYEIFLNSISDMEKVDAELHDMLPIEYSIQKVTDILPHFFDWFKFLDRNIVLIITLLIVVAAFNMVSVLLIMIMERTPMVGLLKSLGATGRQIRDIFIVNGMKIIAYGLLWGNLISIIIAFIQWKFKFLKLDAQNYYMDFVPISWSWTAVFLVNIGVFIIVALVVVLPAGIVRNINPVTALKYKD